MTRQVNPLSGLLITAAVGLSPTVSFACLHGATGREQASIVRGDVRMDRIRATVIGSKIIKIFVAAPDAKVSGTVLSADEAKLFDQLGTIAADIDSEGMRGMGKSISFAGSDVKGTLIPLDAKHFPDWASVIARVGIPSKGASMDEYYTLWLAKIRADGRMAYALTADVQGGDTVLAINISNTGDTSRIIADKVLETYTQDILNITWFQGLSAAEAAQAVGAVASEAGQLKEGPNFKTSTVMGTRKGTADIRVRGGSLTISGQEQAVTGIVWMR